ncbi:hypothetical protein PHMEG_00022822 [Phytophthora megakarya]|uniref:Fe2OG dioxygenase domain-containing protein n=1 Tax=Phytophthora megakarya TaxID=4795 RepID=A0A225VI95_9STRA|nr:hypothetical protein PHMEG_00022822 [Phytophthora megakarya]
MYDYDDEPEDGVPFEAGNWPFGLTGQAKDVPTPHGAACAQISNIFGQNNDDDDEIETETTAGEFSFGGQADTLPVAPGLFVDEVGAIALPLRSDLAEKLVAKCEKSPFGRKLDTMMDENIRKSWQLAPDQVEIRNPLWHTGMEKLSETIAGRLGYKGVPMQCILYKMLVYGEGGHFVKHQDTEKEDGMVATMVVQLPSLHEGGDLIVYRGGEVKYRHDFGKKEDTAAYLPHYAVHYADAEHALEKVTKGYRLILVYSICLPSNMRALERNPAKSMSEELAGAITCMGPEDKVFSLLLSHEYTKKSITDLGSGALKGVDRARVDALMEANNLVESTNKLQFFFADLTHEASYFDDGGEWKEDEHSESITWYSVSGQELGTASKTMFDLNFLNPDQESLAQMWEDYGESETEGYYGNEGATKNTTYARYALVAWPVSNGVENTLKFINASAAIDILQAQKHVPPEALRSFINAVAGSTSLVNLFFTTVCSNVENKNNLVPAFVALARTYKWDDIGIALMSSLRSTAADTSYGFVRMGEVNDTSMMITLQLADKFEQMDPSLLRPVTNVFVQELGDIDASNDKFAVLAAVAAIRIKWLQNQIQVMDKPFTWEMPNAVFPDGHIQAFLRGPEVSMKTVGVMAFGGLPAARKFAERTPQTHASFSMVPDGRGKDAYVTITKTRMWFNKQQSDLVQHKEELKLLTDRFGEGSREGPALKRARIGVWEHRG